MKTLGPLGLTFDDLLLLPGYSDILPSDVSVETLLHPKLSLKTPIISAAMDTVTEHRMARAIAQLGGLGIIHKNMSIESQAGQVKKVKKFESGIIQKPLTISPDNCVEEALRIMRANDISGLPVTRGKVLEGILTNRDLRFETRLQEPVSSFMTPKEKLVTAPLGIDFAEARKILHTHRIEKLPVVNDKGELEGLITIKDIKKAESYPLAAKDVHGRLIVGAAVGASCKERISELVSAGVDVLCVDTAHGHTKNVLEQVRYIKKKFPEILLIAGNVAEEEGALALISAGADVLKVGMGPGSICTTRIISGVGVPQATAISFCVQAAQKKNVSVISDGGIKFSGDVVKALALGANAVMIGSLLAGSDESPGETLLYRGRTYKTYRGMGSVEAMKKGSKDRYGQKDVSAADKLVPEGIEGRVPYSGSVQDILFQLVGGLKSGMGYVGAQNLKELRAKARWIQVSFQGLRESHAHDVQVTKESPNYRSE